MDKQITARRKMTNPTWPSELRLRLICTSNGYWWTGERAGNGGKDATVYATAIRPGRSKRVGWQTATEAIRCARRQGWTVEE